MLDLSSPARMERHTIDSVVGRCSPSPMSQVASSASALARSLTIQDRQSTSTHPRALSSIRVVFSMDSPKQSVRSANTARQSSWRVRPTLLRSTKLDSPIRWPVPALHLPPISCAAYNATPTQSFSSSIVMKPDRKRLRAVSSLAWLLASM